MVLQKKLSVIDKVGLGRTNTGKFMRQTSGVKGITPRDGGMPRKQVTFKGEPTFRTQKSQLSDGQEDLRSAMAKIQ